MPLQSEAIKQSALKQIAVRWPDEFWRRAKIAAILKGVSMSHAMTMGAANFLGIDPPPEAVTEESER